MNEEDPKKMSRYGAAITIVAAVVLISMACWWAYVSNVGLAPSHNSADWGAFGSYFGGVLGPVLSTASILFIWWQSQKTDKRALKQQVVMDEQLKMIRVQQFESTFFKLYEHHKILINDKKIIIYDEEPQSIRDVFSRYFGSWNFIDDFEDVRLEANEYIKSLFNISTLIVDNKDSLGDKDIFFSDFIRTFFDEAEFRFLLFYLAVNKGLYDVEIQNIISSKIVRAKDVLFYDVYFDDGDSDFYGFLEDVPELIRVCLVFLRCFDSYEYESSLGLLIKRFDNRLYKEFDSNYNLISLSEERLKYFKEKKEVAIDFLKRNNSNIFDDVDEYNTAVEAYKVAAGGSNANEFDDFDFNDKTYESTISSESKNKTYKYLAYCDVGINKSTETISSSQRLLEELTEVQSAVKEFLEPLTPPKS